MTPFPAHLHLQQYSYLCKLISETYFVFLLSNLRKTGDSSLVMFLPNKWLKHYSTWLRLAQPRLSSVMPSPGCDYYTPVGIPNFTLITEYLTLHGRPAHPVLALPGPGIRLASWTRRSDLQSHPGQVGARLAVFLVRVVSVHKTDQYQWTDNERWEVEHYGHRAQTARVLGGWEGAAHVGKNQEPRCHGIESQRIHCLPAWHETVTNWVSQVLKCYGAGYSWCDRVASLPIVGQLNLED